MIENLVYVKIIKLAWRQIYSSGSQIHLTSKVMFSQSADEVNNVRRNLFNEGL